MQEFVSANGIDYRSRRPLWNEGIPFNAFVNEVAQRVLLPQEDAKHSGETTRFLGTLRSFIQLTSLNVGGRVT